MLSAGEFILQLRHFLFGVVQHGSEFVREPQIAGGAMNFRAAFQLRAQTLAQLVYVCSNLFEQRSCDALALVQQRGKKMFVRDFGIIRLRRQVLRSLQRLLHLLRVFVDAHLFKNNQGAAVSKPPFTSRQCRRAG